MEASQQLVSGRMPDGMVLELMLVKMLKKDRTPAGA
jgi:hypothetical protein